MLNRSTRSVRLTPEGESLLPLAKRLLADWDNTEEMLRQRFTLQLGSVAVAAMPSFAGNQLPSLLASFRRRHPGINVTVHDVINEEVIDMVRQGRVELGIAFEPEASETLQVDPLFMDRFVAVVPADSELADYRDLDWPRLLTQDFITLQRPSTVRRMLERRLGDAGISLAVAFESHQLTTVGRMVADGLGVSAVPSLCIEQMHELGARCLPLHSPIIERTVGVLSPGTGELSMAAQALRDVLRDGVAPPALAPSDARL